MKQFIGQKEILGIVEVGEGFIEAKYFDGSSELMIKKMFDAIVKENEIDLTTLRQNRAYPVVKDILKVLLEWGVKVNELGFLFDLTIMSVNESLKGASEKLWNKPEEERTMFDVDKVLKDVKKE